LREAVLLMHPSSAWLISHTFLKDFTVNHPRSFFLLFVAVLVLFFCLNPHPSYAWYPLNDTGIQFCGEAEDGNNDPCLGTEPQGQDAHYGRDVAARAGTLTKVGAGEAGFDFTKISNNGDELPPDAVLGSGPDDWACTLDNVTGMMWEVKVSNHEHLRYYGHTYAWYFADSPDGNPGDEGNITSCSNTLDGENCNTENYATKVNTAGLCGYTDWRVPSIKELESIAHQGKNFPGIDTAYFPDTSSPFWSASPNAGDSNLAWYVGFCKGFSYIGYRDRGGRVLLARGGQQHDPLEEADFCKENFLPSNPDSVYTDHGDGTVTDVRTGITWKRCSEGQTWDGSTCVGNASYFTWAGALQQAGSTIFAGHSDWRLPNVKELRSLVEECRSNPTVNLNIFPATPSSYFWSASPYADVSHYAWLVNFHDGWFNYYNRSYYGGRVRLARGGQWFGLYGELAVTIEPAAAREAGAQWRRVGASTWLNNGDTESDVPTGSHIVEFKDVDGWTTPGNITVSVTEREATEATVTYTLAPIPDPEAIPTLSQWGMLILIFLMLVLGGFYLTRLRFDTNQAA